MNKLKEESVEKLVSLMLFAKTRGYQFMPGYKLSKIEFTLKPHAREQFTGKIEMTASGKHVGIEDLAIMAASMAEGWAKKLGCEEQYLSDVDDQERNGPLEVFKLLIEYMGYQTVHLCTYYDKFRNLFDVIEYDLPIPRYILFHHAKKLWNKLHLYFLFYIFGKIIYMEYILVEFH